jgi:glycosyltransferase involved in cell wall biosynthesis
MEVVGKIMMEPKSSQACYVIVSPVRDEAEYLDATIRSVVEQTIRPAQYILVNDGSSDATLEIIQRWAAQHPWIVAVDRPGAVDGAAQKTQDRGKRAREAKEIIAFYHGFPYITVTEWDFLVKLDGDLGFAADYFERCFDEFEKDPKLGVGGGDICHLENEVPVVEKNPQFHVRGATKIYRKACWDAIGGVVRGTAWDTLDELKANMLGWSTRSFPGLEVIHFRYTGAANGKWQNAVKKGEWNYISGYHPLFMATKIGRNLFKRPLIKGAAGLLYGYVSAFLTKTVQVDDAQLIRYIQDQQLRRLFFRETIWR